MVISASGQLLRRQVEPKVFPSKLGRQSMRAAAPEIVPVSRAPESKVCNAAHGPGPGLQRRWDSESDAKPVALI